jgi:hypothetical protein
MAGPRPVDPVKDSKTNKTAPQGAVFFGDWRRAGKMGELPGVYT